jgi:hypothetical protein
MSVMPISVMQLIWMSSCRTRKVRWFLRPPSIKNLPHWAIAESGEMEPSSQYASGDASKLSIQAPGLATR